jgi:hypothetical protein
MHPGISLIDKKTQNFNKNFFVDSIFCHPSNIARFLEKYGV